jgi:hypothetical protein
MKNTAGIEVPNPGSEEAGKMGCLCPVLDNEHGRGIPYPRTDGKNPVEFPSFWTRDDCPIHGTIVVHPKETDG